MSRYVLSQTAAQDVIALQKFGILNFGRTQSLKYHASLEQAFSALAAFPLMARERTEFRPAIRIHHHARHYILYVMRKDHIRIVRVLRDEVDIGRHLQRA